MEKSETKKNPAFLEYVYQLNGGTNLKEALKLSLKDINDIDIAQLNRIGLTNWDLLQMYIGGKLTGYPAENANVWRYCAFCPTSNVTTNRPHP